MQNKTFSRYLVFEKVGTVVIRDGAHHESSGWQKSKSKILMSNHVC